MTLTNERSRVITAITWHCVLSRIGRQISLQERFLIPVGNWFTPCRDWSCRDTHKPCRDRPCREQLQSLPYYTGVYRLSYWSFLLFLLCVQVFYAVFVVLLHLYLSVSLFSLLFFFFFSSEFIKYLLLAVCILAEMKDAVVTFLHTTVQEFMKSNTAFCG